MADTTDEPQVSAPSGPAEATDRTDDLGAPETKRTRIAASREPVEIPSQRRVLVCESITPGGEKCEWRASYGGLMRPMVLAGGDHMRTDDLGAVLLTERLRRHAPWLEPAIAAIERQLVLQNWAGRPWIAWRPLYLVGPPGTGKSYLARKIAELAGTGHGVIDLAGMSDNRLLEGTPRGYSTAQPCWPAMVIEQKRCANPVLVVDEIDKAGGSERNGRPLDTLLCMIERETARDYFDPCLLAPVDLSHVCWIFAGNTAETLPAPLRSRLEIIRIEPPDAEHYDGLVTTMLVDLARRWDLPPAAMPDIPAHANRILREMFARTRSVRRLQRHLEGVIAGLVPSHPQSVH